MPGTMCGLNRQSFGVHHNPLARPIGNQFIEAICIEAGLLEWLPAAPVWQRQFGRRSESQIDENQQLLSFLIEGVAALKPEPKAAPPPTDPGKKGHGRARLPKSLLRDLVTHDLPKKDQRCNCCGKRLVVIVGQRKALAMAIRNGGTRRRWSKLREWLLPDARIGPPSRCIAVPARAEGKQA